MHHNLLSAGWANHKEHIPGRVALTDHATEGSALLFGSWGKRRQFPSDVAGPMAVVLVFPVAVPIQAFAALRLPDNHLNAVNNPFHDSPSCLFTAQYSSAGLR
jgi:hypothetical protein